MDETISISSSTDSLANDMKVQIVCRTLVKKSSSDGGLKSSGESESSCLKCAGNNCSTDQENISASNLPSRAIAEEFRKIQDFIDSIKPECHNMLHNGGIDSDSNNIETPSTAALTESASCNIPLQESLSTDSLIEGENEPAENTPRLSNDDDIMDYVDTLVASEVHEINEQVEGWYDRLIENQRAACDSLTNSAVETTDVFADELVDQSVETIDITSSPVNTINTRSARAINAVSVASPAPVNTIDITSPAAVNANDVTSTRAINTIDVPPPVNTFDITSPPADEVHVLDSSDIIEVADESDIERSIRFTDLVVRIHDIFSNGVVGSLVQTTNGPNLSRLTLSGINPDDVVLLNNDSDVEIYEGPSTSRPVRQGRRKATRPTQTRQCVKRRRKDDSTTNENEGIPNQEQASNPSTNSPTCQNSNLGTRECPICLDQLQSNKITSTICGHVFCTPCIEAAVKSSKKCPNCRTKLTLKKIHPLFL